MNQTLALLTVALALAAPAAAQTPAAAPVSGVESPAPPSSIGSAEEAFARVLARTPRLTEDEAKRAETLLNEAAAAEPSESKWPLALSMLATNQGRTDDAAALAKRAVELGPNVADNHARLGEAIFSGMSGKGVSAAFSGDIDRGKKALLRAVELDPSHIYARFGLGQYYLRAPGIVGGSYKKAREQGRALVAIPAGAYLGHLLLALIASDQDEWDEMTTEINLARGVASNPTEKSQAVAALAQALLRDKEDPTAAIPVIEEYAALVGPQDTGPHYLMAQARQARKEWSAAVDEYLKVLATRPEAMNSRYAIAQCYAALGDNAAAIEHYQEFVNRFPQDDRAGDAKKAIKKLGKKTG